MHTKECAEIKHILKSSRGPVYRRLRELAVQVEPVEAWMLCHFWCIVAQAKFDNVTITYGCTGESLRRRHESDILHRNNW